MFSFSGLDLIERTRNVQFLYQERGKKTPVKDFCSRTWSHVWFLGERKLLCNFIPWVWKLKLSKMLLSFLPFSFFFFLLSRFFSSFYFCFSFSFVLEDFFHWWWKQNLAMVHLNWWKDVIEKNWEFSFFCFFLALFPFIFLLVFFHSHFNVSPFK